VDPEASWEAEATLLREAAPRHILFLCVANSARSQLGEGIARSLAPRDVKISSAGSVPTSVRPQAIEVLREIGIDIDGQRSKGVGGVDRPVDAVITLCAEEVCPVWLENATRLHWGLPDPAAVEGSDTEQLDAFRAVRDELMGRLRVLFARISD
jgi:protein-tyrosine-phosphatase